ncbi:thioredoxin domain-containing protein [Aeromonas veronii]|uniref:hypothetical protein n=1 Tax=Aeromonas veronii TaxID=654 RepID=UPI0038D3A34E|nr:hypothetical protein [Aeromonas veronii]
MFKLYYYPNNASLAPHFLLHHVQADYELLLVDKKTNSQNSPGYLKLNPAGSIPTLSLMASLFLKVLQSVFIFVSCIQSMN